MLQGDEQDQIGQWEGDSWVQGDQQTAAEEGGDQWQCDSDQCDQSTLTNQHQQHFGGGW